MPFYRVVHTDTVNSQVDRPMVALLLSVLRDVDGFGVNQIHVSNISSLLSLIKQARGNGAIASHFSFIRLQTRQSLGTSHNSVEKSASHTDQGRDSTVVTTKGLSG